MSKGKFTNNMATFLSKDTATEEKPAAPTPKKKAPVSRKKEAPAKKEEPINEPVAEIKETVPDPVKEVPDIPSERAHTETHPEEKQLADVKEQLRSLKSRKVNPRFDDGTDINEMSRGTYYFTYEELSAIEYISQKENAKKYQVVRTLIKNAIEEYEPGLLTSPEILQQAMRKAEIDLSKKRKSLS